MTPALPKPAKRGPKPRKRIARTFRPARRTRPKAQRQTQRAKGVRAAKALWSRFMRARADGRCEYCSARGTDGHHLFGQGAHPELRFLKSNGAWLCRQCHNNAHRWPESFAQWFMARFPDRFREVWRLAVSASLPSLAEQVEELRRQRRRR